MTDKIITMPIAPPVDQELVDMLSEMLEEAKSGKLLSIAGCMFDAGGDNINFTSVEPEDELKMLGGLMILVDDYKFNHLELIDD